MKGQKPDKAVFYDFERDGEIPADKELLISENGSRTLAPRKTRKRPYITATRRTRIKK